MSTATTSRQFSQLVFNTTRWQERLFDSRRKGAGLSTVLANTSKALSLEGEVASKATDLGLEVFARLYDSPERLEEADEATPWAPKVHEILDSMTEFGELAALTASDPDMAALGTMKMLEAVEGRLPALIRADRDGEAPTFKGGEFQVTAEDRLRAALRVAASDAYQQVADAKAALEGISPGLGQAPGVHEQEDPKRALLAQKLLGSKQLRQIVDLAGRLQRIAAQIKKQRDPNLLEEVVDIERGGDIGRILPSELAGLRSSRIRRLLTLQRVAERTALQYRLEGKEPQGRGEMIVALDESGSMGVQQKGIIPNVWARAVGLACLRIGRQDRRAVTVIGFNGGLTSRHRLEADGRCLRWENGAWEPMNGGFAALAMDVISKGCDGGTSFDAPISYAIQALAGADKPDLLFVTDGEALVSGEVELALKKAKAEKGLRVFGIAMGHGSITPILRNICDEAIDFAPDAAKLAQVVPG